MGTNCPSLHDCRGSSRVSVRFALHGEKNPQVDFVRRTCKAEKSGPMMTNLPTGEYLEIRDGGYRPARPWEADESADWSKSLVRCRRRARLRKRGLPYGKRCQAAGTYLQKLIRLGLAPKTGRGQFQKNESARTLDIANKWASLQWLRNPQGDWIFTGYLTAFSPSPSKRTGTGLYHSTTNGRAPYSRRRPSRRYGKRRTIPQEPWRYW